MNSYRASSPARLHALCAACGRNYKKVIVREPDGMYMGYCPKCWADPSRYGPRARAFANGATIHSDLRSRRPEWTAERKAEEAAILETIQGIENLVAAGEIADTMMLGLQRRALARLRSTIVADFEVVR